MIPQALAWSISGENTKSSVWHKENLHLLQAMHSIFDHILPTCSAKFHCEPLSHPTPRLGVRPVPSSKPFKNVDGEHRAGPWLTQCNEIMQKSVDFNRSLLFNPGRGVFAASFWSPTCSSASCFCLNRWNHYSLCFGWRVGDAQSKCVNASAVNGTCAHTK